MKNKIVKMAKYVIIGFIGLFVLLMILANMGGNSETPESVSEPSLGTFTLDGELNDGLENTNVNLWKSYEDRTLVIGLPSATQVELFEREVIGDVQFDGGQGGYEYCKVQYQDKVGWLDCAWLR